MFALSFYSKFSVQGLATGLGNFLKLYHESLAALVQGYREVTMDHEDKFRFENGEKVKDRLGKFEEKLYRSTTGRSKPPQQK
jgi:hypothetical protein